VRDLAATSSEILENVEKLKSLEVRRREANISTPRFHEVTDEIEATSKAIWAEAYRERTLAKDIDTTDVTIEDVNREASRK
jgi:hypothetical protein